VSHYTIDDNIRQVVNTVQSTRLIFFIKSNPPIFHIFVPFFAQKTRQLRLYPPIIYVNIFCYL